MPVFSIQFFQQLEACPYRTGYHRALLRAVVPLLEGDRQLRSSMSFHPQKIRPKTKVLMNFEPWCTWYVWHSKNNRNIIVDVMSSYWTMLHRQATPVEIFLCCLQQIFLPVPVSSFGTVLGSSHSSSSSSWQTATHLHCSFTCPSFTCHIVTTEMTSNGSNYAKKQKTAPAPE